MPLAILVGTADRLANLKDVHRARDELLAVVDSKLVYYKEYADYGHMSFMWGIDGKNTYFQDLFTLLEAYS